MEETAAPDQLTDATAKLAARLDELTEQLTAAQDALLSREYFSAFAENPSPKNYGETADNDGREAFEARLGKPFKGLLQETDGAEWIGEEVSPYTLKPLAVKYPGLSADEMLVRAEDARASWDTLDVEDRLRVLLYALTLTEQRFFEIAYATMHTTGQGYMMAFQASGPHAADRAMEALALTAMAIDVPPGQVDWIKPMGKGNLEVTKEFTTMPLGLGLAIGCSTFPTWNSLPGIYASLAAGAPVIVKPHPGAVLPLAIAVACIQEALDGFDIPVDVCQLAVDTVANPIAKALADSTLVKIIDYTGGNAFGDYLEGLRGKALFTEKNGINMVMLDSAPDLDAVLANLAFSVSLYSGQMCTAPHHILVPEDGVETDAGTVPYEEVARRFAAAVDALCQNPKAGPFILGAIQNPSTLARIEHAKRFGTEILESKEIAHPQFPKARIVSPAVLMANADQEELLSQECFGPVAFVVKVEDISDALDIAAGVAERSGAISGSLYSTDEDLIEQVCYEMNRAGVPMAVNLTGQIYMNQNAAFSDRHMSGGNPAGTGALGDLSFVTRRFFTVGNKRGR